MTNLGKVKGSTIHSASGVPSSGLGLDDDQYMDTATGNVYKKVSGSWVLQFNIMGPAGPTGAAGIAGANGVDANTVTVSPSEPASPATDDVWITAGKGVKNYDGAAWQSNFNNGQLLRHILSDSVGGFIGIGTTIRESGTGSKAAENQSFGPSTKIQSAFAQAFGVESGTVFQTAGRVEIKVVCSMHTTIGANTRFWLGLFQALPSNTVNGGTPHIGISFDNAIDTYWYLSTYNGTTQTRKASSQKAIAEESNAFHLTIEAGTVTLDIFSYPAYVFLETISVSTDLPSSSLDLPLIGSCGSTTGAARLILHQLSINI